MYGERESKQKGRRKPFDFNSLSWKIRPWDRLHFVWSSRWTTDIGSLCWAGIPIIVILQSVDSYDKMFNLWTKRIVCFAFTISIHASWSWACETQTRQKTGPRVAVVSKYVISTGRKPNRMNGINTRRQRIKAIKNGSTNRKWFCSFCVVRTIGVGILRRTDTTNTLCFQPRAFRISVESNKSATKRRN